MTPTPIPQVPAPSHFWDATSGVSFWLDVSVGVITVVSLVWAVLAATRSQLEARDNLFEQRRNIAEVTVLRDMSRLLNNDDELRRLLHRPSALKIAIESYLVVLPPAGLAEWRFLATEATPDQIIDRYDPGPQPIPLAEGHFAPPPATYTRYRAGKGRMPLRIQYLIRQGLLEDLRQAITRQQERETITK